MPPLHYDPNKLPTFTGTLPSISSLDWNDWVYIGTGNSDIPITERFNYNAIRCILIPISRIENPDLSYHQIQPRIAWGNSPNHHYFTEKSSPFLSIMAPVDNTTNNQISQQDSSLVFDPTVEVNYTPPTPPPTITNNIIISPTPTIPTPTNVNIHPRPRFQRIKKTPKITSTEPKDFDPNKLPIFPYTPPFIPNVNWSTLVYIGQGDISAIYSFPKTMHFEAYVLPPDFLSKTRLSKNDIFSQHAFGTKERHHYFIPNYSQLLPIIAPNDGQPPSTKLTSTKILTDQQINFLSSLPTYLTHDPNKFYKISLPLAKLAHLPPNPQETPTLTKKDIVTSVLSDIISKLEQTPYNSISHVQTHITTITKSLETLRDSLKDYSIRQIELDL